MILEFIIRGNPKRVRVSSVRKLERIVGNLIIATGQPCGYEWELTDEGGKVLDQKLPPSGHSLRNGDRVFLSLKPGQAA